MNIPEKTSEIQVDGHTFILHKMDAQKASFMLLKLLKIIKPIFKNIDFNKEDIDLGDLNIESLIDGLCDLPQKDFEFIQQNALKSVQEILPGDKPFVLNQYNEFQSPDIKEDVGLVMNITIKSLYFNLKGFFSGNLLTSLKAKLNTLQPNSKI